MVAKKKNPHFNVARMQELVHGSPMKQKDLEILAKSAVYRAKLAKLRRLESKIQIANRRIAQATLDLKELGPLPKRETKKALVLTIRKMWTRQRKPSSVRQNNSAKLDMDHERGARDRIAETLRCAKVVHGATAANTKPALDGLWSTLVSSCSNKELQNYIESSKSVMSKSVSPIIKKQVKQFENCLDNISRSVKVLYRGGIISKTKYKEVRMSSLKSKNSNKTKKGRIEFMDGVPIPLIMPYDKLINFIKSLDIGTLSDISAKYCNDLPDDDKVEGKYRDLEDLLLRVARLYLHIEDNFDFDDPLLHWFDDERGAFKITIGADGAPFGKESEATAWLISVINVTSHVYCCNDNFLLCGSNCKEDHIAMVRYARDLVKSITEIESKVYKDIVDGVNISFKFDLVPSDMKWIAFFAGELNNAAHYFSTFANVNADNKNVVGGSFGNSPLDTWQPWEYDHRLEVADKIKELTEELDKKSITEGTKRKKILDKIRNEKSRQERAPIIGKLVDKCLAEPLHLTNNAWQFFNKQVLTLVIDVSHIPSGITCATDLPDDCPFLVYLNAIKYEVKCNLLYIKLKKWFKSGISKPFDFRFTGKESKLFSHNFMYLISSVEMSVPAPTAPFTLKLHALAYLGLHLRDAVSLFARQKLSPNYLSDLKSHCNFFFNTASIFLNTITPTVWTIGYVVPKHAEITVRKYSLGLGINSMQGREAKHTRLAAYAGHSSLSTNRWDLVFRHEYLTTFYLRERDPFASLFKHENVSYVPSRIETDTFCYCGISKSADEAQCRFCSDPLRNAILRSCQTGQLDAAISQFLSTLE